MNREIIFRGKSLVTNEWVYGSLVKCGNENHIIGFDEVDLDGHHIRYCSDRPVLTKQKTIGQFTGLCDKNGKEIYEGDIVKTKEYGIDIANGVFCSNVAGYDTFLIAWNNGGFILKNHKRYFRLCRCSHIEVIGNIYDNPERMEETK